MFHRVKIGRTGILSSISAKLNHLENIRDIFNNPPPVMIERYHLQVHLLPMVVLVGHKYVLVLVRHP